MRTTPLSTTDLTRLFQTVYSVRSIDWSIRICMPTNMAQQEIEIISASYSIIIIYYVVVSNMCYIHAGDYMHAAAYKFCIYRFALAANY